MCSWDPISTDFDTSWYRFTKYADRNDDKSKRNVVISTSASAMYAYKETIKHGKKNITLRRYGYLECSLVMRRARTVVVPNSYLDCKRVLQSNVKQWTVRRAREKEK